MSKILLEVRGTLDEQADQVETVVKALDKAGYDTFDCSFFNEKLTSRIKTRGVIRTWYLAPGSTLQKLVKR